MFCCESFGDKKLIIFVITIYLENCTCGFFIYFNKKYLFIYSFPDLKFRTKQLSYESHSESIKYIVRVHITNPILV